MAKQFAARANLGVQIVAFDPAEDCCLQSAEAEVERIAFHLRQREPDRLRIAEGRDADELGMLMFRHMQKKCDAVCEYLREETEIAAESMILPEDASL